MEKALAFAVFSASLYSKAASGQRKDAQAFDCVFPRAILFRRRMAVAPRRKIGSERKNHQYYSTRGSFSALSLNHSLTHSLRLPYAQSSATSELADAFGARTRLVHQNDR